MLAWPAGTVTFLYTDLEGSTRLWEQHPAAMRLAVDRHLALLRAAIAAHGGAVFRTVGDGLCAAFATAPAAVAAARQGQQSLQTENWGATGPLRARMALHTGAAEVQGGDYVGACLNRLGRLLAAGHGGQTLLSQATADLAREALPEGAGLRDLGEQRLRDLSQAEHVYQLLHPDLLAEFPPLRSLETLPNNLPLQLTSFVGRERELAEVTHALGDTRLLTLTGTGGCGKTRLALQVATELLDRYPDGVWLAELAPLANPTLLPTTVAGVLGVREQPGEPIETTLADRLRTKHLVLLLDNCEHLLDSCAQLADAFLRGCPGIQILATSREALGIAGEASKRVPSLRVPAADVPVTSQKLVRYGAVQLFIERARSTRAALALTEQSAMALARVCRRLDGMPLAIELAAARTRVLSVEQIEARLDDCFRLLTGGSRVAMRRQQTFLAAVDWRYDLLSGTERTLFRRLAVFAGGWALEAAEAVCAGDGVGREEILDLVAGLVDKSLVLAEEQPDGAVRYRLLETLRQYAGEKLLAAEELPARRDAHAQYFLARAVRERHRTLPYSPDAARADSVELERTNLLAAVDWAEHAAPSTGGATLTAEAPLRLALTMVPYWMDRGSAQEGIIRLRRLLGLPRTQQYSGPTTMTAGLALAALAYITYHSDDMPASRGLAEQSVAILRVVGDRAALARALGLLTICAYGEDDYAAARAAGEESVTLAREVGDRAREGIALRWLGGAARRERDFGRARQLAEAALTVFRAAGVDEGIATALTDLGYIAEEEGDLPAARGHIRQALAMTPSRRTTALQARCVAGLAGVALLSGDLDRSARLFGAATAAWEQRGARIGQADRRTCEPQIAGLRIRLGASAFAVAWAEGQALSPELAVAHALEERV